MSSVCDSPLRLKHIIMYEVFFHARHCEDNHARPEGRSACHLHPCHTCLEEEALRIADEHAVAESCWDPIWILRRSRSHFRSALATDWEFACSAQCRRSRANSLIGPVLGVAEEHHWRCGKVAVAVSSGSELKGAAVDRVAHRGY